MVGGMGRGGGEVVVGGRVGTAKAERGGEGGEGGWCLPHTVARTATTRTHTQTGRAGGLSVDVCMHDHHHDQHDQQQHEVLAYLPCVCWCSTR